jgi:hypothetical protein
MPLFAYKLFPPRPTFPADLTPEEGANMGQHVASVTERADEGSAVDFGAVHDPAQKRTISPLLLAAVLAVAALIAVGGASAQRSSNFNYVVHNAGLAYLTKGGLSTRFPGSLKTGDQIFARDLLYQGSKKIGYDNESCTVTFDNNDLCRVLSVFAGKGTLESTWIWINRNSSPLGPTHFSGVMDGGTGSFEHLSGQFDATALPDGRVHISVRLS